MAKTRKNRSSRRSRRSRRSSHNHRGAGYQTSQQMFDSAVKPPMAFLPTYLTTAPTADMVRPVLPSTFVGQAGGGYMTSQQVFDPSVKPPMALLPTYLTTAPTGDMVRPVMPSTFAAQAGGSRKARMTRKKGGFYPSVMGPFLANAQAAIVPLALYALYHTTVPKLASRKKGGKIRRSTRM